MKDVAYGLVVPVLVGILIMLFPTVIGPAANRAFPAMTSDYAFITQILTHGFAMMVMFAIPIILGLVWNKWAGGAAGFIMGTLYYVAMAGYTTAGVVNTYILATPDYQQTLLTYGFGPRNYFADPSFIGDYIVVGVLIGYIAGSLVNGSMGFKRMLGAGLTAALTCGVIQFILNYTVSFQSGMTTSNPPYAFFIVMLPMILLGIIGPIIAKVMTWYGLQPVRH
jgi:hypothetical protein